MIRAAALEALRAEASKPSSLKNRKRSVPHLQLCKISSEDNLIYTEHHKENVGE